MVQPSRVELGINLHSHTHTHTNMLLVIVRQHRLIDRLTYKLHVNTGSQVQHFFEGLDDVGYVTMRVLSPPVI